MNYNYIGDINFKSGFAIFGDPCYWWDDDKNTENVFDDVVSDCHEFKVIKHTRGHDGAGCIFNVGVGEKRVFVLYAENDTHGKCINVGRPASYVISIDGSDVPERKAFQLIDVDLDVDAGITYVGDYGSMFSGEENIPVDLNSSWNIFTDKYFDRSGYRKYTMDRSSMLYNIFDCFEVTNMDKGIRDIVSNAAQVLAKSLNLGYDLTLDFTSPDKAIESKNTIKKLFEQKQKEQDKCWKCYAAYKHDDNTNVGYIIDTNYGDGSYPIAVAKNSSGEITHIMVIYEDIK